MEPNNAPRFAFGPRNYRLMFIGLAVLAAGFVTMTLDTADYGAHAAHTGSRCPTCYSYLQKIKAWARR